MWASAANGGLKEKSEAIAQIQSFFSQEVAPIADSLDRDARRLAEVFGMMGDRQLLALQLPATWGGMELDESDFQRFQMICARYSGALAFLQAQHQSAGNLIASSHNPDLAQTYLPDMASGKRRIGVGFSQLRRAGKPPLTALPIRGGYLLSGTVPWITGWEIFEECIVGAALPSGEALYGLVPLKVMRQASGGSIALSPPLALAAMNSTQTVVGTLENWRLEGNRVLAIKPASAIHQSDRRNVLNHSFLALGCAQAGLDILRQISQVKPLDSIARAREILESELDDLAVRHFASIDSVATPYARRLKLRGAAIDLASRCARAAAIATGGAANIFDQPAQRVYREALLFSVSGQTPDVMAESLAQAIAKG